MTKTQALINYLITYPNILNNPLYLNLVDAKNNVNQIQTISNDRALNVEYIDGSVKKRFSLTITTYLSMSINPIVKMGTIDNENVSDLQKVQDFMDWVNLKNELREFPSLGDNLVVEEIGTTANTPRLDGIDATQSIPLGKYSFTIYVDYIDNTKAI